MPDDVALSLNEAVPLAYTLVAAVARRRGIRVLFIKGPVAQQQDLRSSYASVDVDVLVDPDRRAELAATLTEMGWVDDHPYTSPTVLPQHSRTHRHPMWPCELDLHDRFPGLFVPRDELFAILWERRSSVVVAEQVLTCPDRLSHALILALHSLRDSQESGKRRQVDELVARLQGQLAEADLLELAEVAVRLGASDTAAPFLRALGAPPRGVGLTSAQDMRSWQLRSGPRDPTAVPWINALRELPPRQWPRYLWYAATLSENELRIDNPRLPAGRVWLAIARLRRLRRGLRALPAAVRHTRRST